MTIKLTKYIKYEYVMMLLGLYHHNEFDSTAAAYRIGICIKIGFRTMLFIMLLGVSVR